MIEKADAIRALLWKYMNNELSTDEKEVLDEWVAQSPENRLLFEKFADPDKLHALLGDADELREKFEAIQPSLSEITQLPFGPPVKKIRWYRLVATAAVVLVLLTGAYYIFIHNTPKGGAAIARTLPENDVLPGGEKAELTLADGSTITLDNQQNGIISRQGQTIIHKKETGLVTYDASDVNGNNLPVSYNIVRTPRGGQYQVILPDGTKVWLNAASSLRFPTAFTGRERVVELLGEAFFEVTKKADQPFKVRVRKSSGKLCDVEVLGTDFNIMAYDDEATARVTLVRGKVRVTGATARQPDILLPSQQARIDSGNEAVKVISDVNTAAVTAWVNQTFQFESDDLKTIMHQIARWYDVEVIYEGDIPVHTYTGMMSRKKNLSEVLKILEFNGVHYKIEGKKLTIMP